MTFPKRLLGEKPTACSRATRVLTREEAQALIARTVKLSKADAIRVNVQSAARDQPAFRRQPDVHRRACPPTTTIRVQSVFGKRKA